MSICFVFSKAFEANPCVLMALEDLRTIHYTS